MVVEISQTILIFFLYQYIGIEKIDDSRLYAHNMYIYICVSVLNVIRYDRKLNDLRKRFPCNTYTYYIPTYTNNDIIRILNAVYNHHSYRL